MYIAKEGGEKVTRSLVVTFDATFASHNFPNKTLLIATLNCPSNKLLWKVKFA